MKLIKPSYQIMSDIESDKILKSIELAGRTCYKSEDKITTDSASKFIKMLISKGHESVLEHEKITVKFICDRGVSHELIRHRIASFSQESTRYCNYSKDKFNGLTFIIPEWLDLQEGEYECFQETELIDDFKAVHLSSGEQLFGRDNYSHCIWLRAMDNAQFDYMELLNKSWTPQQARSILPNSLKTEIVVTANIREWRTIFKQRTSKAAHPQMREIMCPLMKELSHKLPELFEDLV